jgi:putative transposase
LRIIGYLDAVSGVLRTEGTSSVTATRLAKSLSQLSQCYPEAEIIYLVWDNWPVHKHPRVQKALINQTRIRIIWLPTYSPWLNPIEKLWRHTKQNLTHAHPWSDDFNQYRQQIQNEFDNLSSASPQLLRYVGLSI